jgi:hypothetical protein
MMPYASGLMSGGMQLYRAMLDNELIKEVLWLKKERGYTLHDPSKRLDLQVTTIERWFKTGHINKVYAQMVREKLGLK